MDTVVKEQISECCRLMIKLLDNLFENSQISNDEYLRHKDLKEKFIKNAKNSD